jgi:hypothetical protein
MRKIWGKEAKKEGDNLTAQGARVAAGRTNGRLLVAARVP